MKRLLLVALAAVLLAGACGGDDSSNVLGGVGGDVDTSDTDKKSDEVDLGADEKAAAARIAASIGDGSGSPAVTKAEAQCVGERVVLELGLDRVDAIDWETSKLVLADQDARGVATAMVECVDVRPAMVEGMSQSGDLTTAQATCLSTDLTDGELVSLLAASFSSDGSKGPSVEAVTPLADAMLNCMDFGSVLVEQFTKGGDLSDKSAKCLADAISDDLLRDLILDGITGEDSSASQAAFSREILASAPGCLTDEEMNRLGNS